MAPKETVWLLDEHTKGKHAVLKHYLDAWFPILSRYNGRVLFIDGFSGPGEYAGGEEGSPLIAIRSVREHTAAAQIKEVVCFFVEKDKARAKHLAKLIEQRKADGLIPDKCKVYAEQGTFDEELTGVLDHIEKQRTSLAPAFVMIDPFGVSETPMSVIERLFRNDRVEVYISFMYEWINRFKAQGEFEDGLDELFGTTEWRKALKIEAGDERKDFLYDLYEARLRKAGAAYVVRFELYAGNRLKYAIFFATKAAIGADRMKQAIWRVVPTGDFAFRGGRGQLALGLPTVDFIPLIKNVENFLKGCDPKEWVKVEEVQEYVIAKTDYHSSQYKTNALKPLEREGKIEVDPTSRNRKGTYPAGTRLRLARRK